ncbi:hypothetical protein FACS1894151_02550 [Spirochaetia bacterium]|nr:hypothetical protein FACS1894151_02550 [Spirochaetia bacterium]
MVKKGCLIFRKNGEIKLSYCHRNSHLRGLGRKVVRLCRGQTIEQLNAIFDRLILVEEESAMTAEQREAYKKYVPPENWTEDFTWTMALKYIRDITEPLKDGFPYLVNYASFTEAWRNRWQYYIDLDTETLDIYKFGLEILCQDSDIISHDTVDYPGGYEPVLVGRFPLSDIPEDWVDICEKNYKKKKIVLVDMD